MPRIRHLTSAVAVALAFSGAAQAQDFSNFIVFGDSLSDAGQYAPFIPGAGSFTTNDDPVWAELLGTDLGFTIAPSVLGGTDFAWGGAPTGGTTIPAIPGVVPVRFLVPGVAVPLFCVPAALPCRSVAQQIADSGPIDSHALYAFWAGANDIFNYLGYASGGLITSAQVQLFTGLSAQNEVGQLAALQAAGARNIIVVNLPDIGAAPNFTNATLFPGQASPAASTAVTQLVTLYNTTLNAGLAQLGDGIIPVDAFSLVNEVLADPGAYGFTNTTGTACNLTLVPSSLFCTNPTSTNPGTLVTPTANQDYLFADGVHPTGAGHAIFAQAVLSELQAPGQVAMLAEAGLKSYEDQSRVINAQIFDGRGREDHTTVGFANLQFSNIGYDATLNTPDSDMNQTSLTVGADYRGSERFDLGGAITLTSQQLDAGSLRADGRAVTFSVYGVFNFGGAYIDAVLGGGSDNFDTHRHIQLGAADRVEEGNTNGTRTAAELGFGYLFGSDIKHGPFIDVTWQKVDINDFAEEGAASTRMTFDSFDRDSMVTRLGYQLHGDMGGWHPYARVAYNSESENDAPQVRAGLVDMNGHFTLPGMVPSDNWWTADLGVAWDFNDTSTMSVSYSGLFADDLQDRNTVNLGVNVKF
jgi:outer membrane lipase/esterase